MVISPFINQCIITPITSITITYLNAHSLIIVIIMIMIMIIALASCSCLFRALFSVIYSVRIITGNTLQFGADWHYYRVWGLLMATGSLYASFCRFWMKYILCFMFSHEPFLCFYFLFFILYIWLTDGVGRTSVSEGGYSGSRHSKTTYLIRAAIAGEATANGFHWECRLFAPFFLNLIYMLRINRHSLQESLGMLPGPKEDKLVN